MSQDKYDDRKWLFTSNSQDTRGNLASKTFLGYDADKIKGSPLEDFIKVKNNENKPAGSRDDQVHEEFVQFIVDAARHARDFDPTVGAISITTTNFAAQATTLVGALKTAAGLQGVPPALPAANNINAVNPGAGTAGTIVALFNAAKAQLTTAIPTGNVGTWAAYADNIISTLEADVARELKGIATVSAPFVTIQSGTAKTVYSNVYARWSSLSPESRAFYDRFVQLQKLSSNQWVPANESEYESAGSNPTQFRLNLKKYANGKTYLGESFPEYSDKVFDGVWSNGALVNDATKLNARTFKDLYDEIYSNKTPRTQTALPNQPNQSSGNIIFHVKVDDLVRNRFFRISSAKAGIPSISTGTSATQQYRLLDMINRNIISRDANGKMVRTVNGVKVELGAEDDETNKTIKQSHYCYSTHVNNTGENCRRFIFECLLSQDASSLDKCLKDLKLVPDFFKVATNDIKTLHPVLALRILQQFGFHKYQEYDEIAGMQLWKVECVSHWLKTYMQSKFTSQEIRDMITQDGQYHILSYLDLISQFVNANPAILNKNYSGSSEEARGKLKPSTYGKQLGLEFEIIKQPSTFILSDIRRLKGHLQQLRATRTLPFAAIRGTRGVFTPFGRQLTPGVSFLQLGGGPKCESIIRKLNDGGQASGYQVIEAYMNAVLKEFENRNKQLDQNDLANIKNNIEKYRELEFLLLQSLCYIDEFNTLSDMLQDYKTDVLTEDNLKKMVNRLSNVNTKIHSTEGQLLNIISKIQDVLGDDNSGNQSEVTVNDWM
jgi:hypothetical protein